MMIEIDSSITKLEQTIQKETGEKIALVAYLV